MTGVQRPKTSVYVPLSTLSVDSRILDIKLKNELIELCIFYPDIGAIVQ